MVERLHGFIAFTLFLISCFDTLVPVKSQNGFLTFYGPAVGGAAQTDSGACGFGALDNTTWPNGRFVSVGSNNTITQSIGSNKAGCGQCLEAQCSGSGCVEDAQPTILYVTDTCACSPNQLNVPRQVFLQYFGQSAALGQVTVTYRQVDCDPPGNVSVKVVKFREESGGYVAFVLLNVAGNAGLLGVDLRSTSNSTWRALLNTYGNVWEGSNLGQAPYDLRLIAYSKPPLVLQNAIPSLNTGVFPSSGQFITQVQRLPQTPQIAPVRAPIGVPPALPPSSGLFASGPSQSSIVYTSQQLPIINLSGVRIDVPLYYPPTDSSLLGGYPGLKFTFTNCRPMAATVNVSIDRLQVPATAGSPSRAWALQSVDYRPFLQIGQDRIYQLVDYSFFNLESGSFAQLTQPAYVSFTNSTYNGRTISVNDPNSNVLVYPKYLNLSAVASPGDFSYTLLLPPGPNEDATEAYLKALKTMFYYLTTLTLGNDGSPDSNPTCGPGYPATSPWADYLRVTLSQLAPTSSFDGDYYDRIPVGQIYSFQERSFIIMSADIEGQVINRTNQLSASDCGVQCRAFSRNSSNSDICKGFIWCGAITGCGASSPYQSCELKASTPTSNITNSEGFLNFAHNSSIRATSGSIFLPAPTGITTLFDNSTGNLSQTSSISSPSTGP